MTRPNLHGEEVPWAFPRGKYGEDANKYRYGMSCAIAYFESAVCSVNIHEKHQEKDKTMYGFIPWNTAYNSIEQYLRLYKLSRQLDKYRSIVGIEYKGTTTDYWYYKALNFAKDYPNYKAITVFNSILKNKSVCEQYSPETIDYQDKFAPEIYNNSLTQ